MLSRFHLIPERYGRTDGQTDRQTDRFAISISRVCMLTLDKNRLKFAKVIAKIKMAPFLRHSRLARLSVLHSLVLTQN